MVVQDWVMTKLSWYAEELVEVADTEQTGQTDSTEHFEVVEVMCRSFCHTRLCRHR